MQKTTKCNVRKSDRECENNKEYKCVICKYTTDRWWSYNKHLDTKKHMKLSAINSNINMEIVKSDVKYNIPVCKEIVAEPSFMDNLKVELDLIDKLLIELNALKEENLLLKMNTDNYTENMDKYMDKYMDNYMDNNMDNNMNNNREFKSIFDSDFSKLFS